MATYYEEVDITQLTGEDGLLQLPTYVEAEFVMDRQRRKAMQAAKRAITRNNNVLITGEAGTGKTALMYMILSSLVKEEKVNLGFLKDATVGTKHSSQKMVLFCDDLPRRSNNMLTSIIRTNARPILATARNEELATLKKKTAGQWRNHFETIKIKEMASTHLLKMLERYAEREGVIIHSDANKIAVQKAKGLPVYIWQLVRDLHINEENLTKERANKSPTGMEQYVDDDILYRVLRGHSDRYAVIALLRAMVYMHRYTMHRRLCNNVYVEFKQELLKTDNTSSISEAKSAITRYLQRPTPYTYRLPHDAWADVLQGESQGLLSDEISVVNSTFTSKECKEVILRSYLKAKNALHNEPAQRQALKKNIKNSFSQKEIEKLKQKIKGKKESKKKRREDKKEESTTPKRSKTSLLGASEGEHLFERAQTILEGYGRVNIDLLATELDCSKQAVKAILPKLEKIDSRAEDIYYSPPYWKKRRKQIEQKVKKKGSINIGELENINIHEKDIERLIKNLKVQKVKEKTLYFTEYWKKLKESSKDIIKQIIRLGKSISIEELGKKIDVPPSEAKIIAKTIDKNNKTIYLEDNFISENIVSFQGSKLFKREYLILKRIKKRIGDIPDFTSKNNTIVALDLSMTDFSDLKLLKKLTNLQTLQLYRNFIKDVTPLQHLTNLTVLNLGGTAVKNITPLQHLTDLEELSLAGTDVETVPPLKHITNLNTLNLGWTAVEDVTPLQHLTNLQWLNLEDTNIRDVTPLQHLTNLTVLNLGGTAVKNITPLQHLTDLEELYLANTEVSELYPLTRLARLEKLNIRATKVEEGVFMENGALSKLKAKGVKIVR